MISVLGLIALAGVVVNDSLVLIDAINRSTRRGVSIHEAVRTASQSRFRAILLTSLTTFLGLTPMMMETSMQARFIVPMAVALAFGVAFATLITLTLMPALYLMIDDAKRLLRLVPKDSHIALNDTERQELVAPRGLDCGKSGVYSCRDKIGALPRESSVSG
jgi:predicted RND superfamily exporter protein